MKFRVFQYMPNPHCRALDEIADCLTASLIDLGYDCDFSCARLSESRTNIVLGAHLMKWPHLSAAPKVIVYQMEQLFTGSPWWKDQYHEILVNIDEIWDFSTANIEFLKGHDIRAKHVPIGYHKSLARIPQDTPKDIDLLFYGSLNERRRSIINGLKASGMKIENLFGIYGEERDHYVARSKAVLNLHFYPTRLLEQPRMAYLLNNQVPIITEESADNPYPEVKFSPVDGREGLWQAGPDAGERFREFYPMVRLLRAVL